MVGADGSTRVAGKFDGRWFDGGVHVHSKPLTCAVHDSLRCIHMMAAHLRNPFVESRCNVAQPWPVGLALADLLDDPPYRLGMHATAPQEEAPPILELLESCASLGAQGRMVTFLTEVCGVDCHQVKRTALAGGGGGRLLLVAPDHFVVVTERQLEPVGRSACRQCEPEPSPLRQGCSAANGLLCAFNACDTAIPESPWRWEVGFGKIRLVLAPVHVRQKIRPCMYPTRI